MPAGLRRKQALIPAQPMAQRLGSDLGSHRHNHLLERNPAIKLTAQITDFCLYNYTVHTPSGTGTLIPVSHSPHSLEMGCVCVIHHTCFYRAFIYPCIKMCIKYPYACCKTYLNLHECACAHHSIHLTKLVSIYSCDRYHHCHIKYNDHSLL